MFSVLDTDPHSVLRGRAPKSRAPLSRVSMMELLIVIIEKKNHGGKHSKLRTNHARTSKVICQGLFNRRNGMFQSSFQSLTSLTKSLVKAWLIFFFFSDDGSLTPLMDWIVYLAMGNAIVCTTTKELSNVPSTIRSPLQYVCMYYYSAGSHKIQSSGRSTEAGSRV